MSNCIGKLAQNGNVQMQPLSASDSALDGRAFQRPARRNRNVGCRRKCAFNTARGSCDQKVIAGNRG